MTVELSIVVSIFGICLFLVEFAGNRWARIAGLVISFGLCALAVAELGAQIAQIHFGFDRLIAADRAPMAGTFYTRLLFPPVPSLVTLVMGAAIGLLHVRGPVATSVAAWIGCVLGIIAILAIAIVIMLVDGSTFFSRVGMPDPISIFGPFAVVFISISILSWSISGLGLYPTHHRFLRPRILLLVSMTGFAVVAFLAWISLAYVATIDIAKSLDAEAATSTRLFEEYTERTLDAAYLMVDRAADMINETGFDHVVSSASDWAKINGMTRSTPQINSIVLIDASGQVRLTSNEFPFQSKNSDASVRDYFKVHRDKGLVTYVGPRIGTALTHLSAFTVSQRIQAPDGSFGGVVLATIKASSFESFFDSLHLSPSIAIGLFRDSGDLLTGVAPVLPNFVADVMANSGADSAGQSIWYPGDGTRRFIAYRRLSDRPLLIASEVLHDNSGVLWRAIEAQTAPILIGILFLLALVTWFSFGNIHREEAHHQQLEELATTDPLTQTANRRAFVDHSRREISRARRFKSPLALLLIDADHFKRINDEHGHAAGDHVLIVLAAICRTHLRNIDIIGRVGGEEFAVALTRTDIAGALIVAEKIRMACASTAIAVPGGTINLTVSIGVAEFNDEMNDINELMQAADTQLYRAKEAGRNQVSA
jgi:diguanylate cyclase (GGDEF)-like protein